MTEQEVFILANTSLNHVIDQIKDDQWGKKVPDGMSYVPDQTLRQIINYHAFDDAWVPDVLAGKTKEEVGDKHDGDLLGDDPKANYAKYNHAANAAVKTFADLDKPVHLSYGDFPAREYLWHITAFRGLRVYDIAKFIGADTHMPDKLVQGLWDQIEPYADQWRQMGVFGPAVAVAASASLQDRLLGLVGRHPDAA